MTIDLPVSGSEAVEHLGYVEQALSLDEPAARRPILGAAILRFGWRFGWSLNYLTEQANAGDRERFEVLSNETLSILTAWLGGEQLSDRADENERRAGAALELLEKDSAMARLAFKAVMKLPPDHPLRADARATAAIERHLTASRAAGDFETVVLAIETLLASGISSPERARELVTEAITLGNNEALPVDTRREALRAAMLWHFMRSVVEREERAISSTGETAGLLAITRPLMSELRKLGTTPQDELSIGSALVEAGELEEGAGTLAKLVDARSEVWATAAWLEASVRVHLGQDDRAITVLESVLPLEESDYLHAVELEDVASDGNRFSKDANRLAFAYARRGRWTDALRTIERAKSPRLRHLVRLRESEAGRTLLAAEARVASLKRGVATSGLPPAAREMDPLGHALTAYTRALEDYRAQRPDLTSASIAPPTIAQVSAELAEGEGIISLGVDRSGFMMIGIVRHDREAPSWTELRPELTYSQILTLFQIGEEPVSGWLLELASRAPVRPRASLEQLLRNIDTAIGASLARFAADYRLRKLTVVPHRLLHAVPYWALASLKHLDVQVAPSLAHWMSWRARTARLDNSAVVVGNPTLDLDLARVEAVSVAMTLSSLGYTTCTLLESAATEEAVRDAVKTASVLHFAGHGFSRPTEPLLCSLLMHPSSHWQWPEVGDPLRALAATAERWTPIVDFARYAEIDAGRIVERFDEFDPNELVERQLDYSTYGTLWGEYFGGRLLQLAELWTAADFLIDDSLGRCSLAFLCACESGRSDLSVNLDEVVGIPSSLEIAGVDVVICTLWPVTDVAALVFASLFYEALSTARGTFDVRATVKACRDRLAVMGSYAVVELLRAMQNKTSDRVVKAYLEVVARDVQLMPEPPFAHLFFWGAFTCYGAQFVKVPEPYA